MAYLILVVAELLGAMFLAGFAKGIFGPVPTLLALVVMLALSFHALAREERPDGTSIRMASFAAVLGYAAILGGKLALEHRPWTVVVAASVFTIACATLCAFATWSVVERPLELDVEEAS